MGRITDGIRRIFGRRRPVTPEEAEVLSTWVNEGGAFHPEGPPPVAEGDPPAADSPAADPPTSADQPER